MTTTERINAFLHAASTRMGTHDSKIASTISRSLNHTYTEPPALPAARVAACEALSELFVNIEDELLQLLADCANDLHWRQAGFGRLPEHLQQKLAVVELLGPSGMFPVADLRFGVLIQCPRVNYPRHYHAAEELYFVMKGTAEWAVDEQLPAPRMPGNFVHHKSMQPHRIMTRQSSLLALWGWTGDIDGSSYSLGKN